MCDIEKGGSVGPDATFVHSLDDQWLHQPHRISERPPVPKSGGVGDSRHANEAQIESRRPNGGPTAPSPLHKKNKPNNKTLGKALSSVMRPKFANPFTHGGWVPGSPPAVMKRNNERPRIGLTSPMRPQTPESDDGSSLFVSERLRDSHPEWTEPIHEKPCQHNLVDYSSESSNDSEEYELEVVYAQDASVANRDNRIPGISSARERTRPTEPTGAISNNIGLGDRQDTHTCAKTTNSHVLRVGNKSSQPRGEGQAQGTSVSQPDPQPETKKNGIIAKPCPKDLKMPSSTEDPGKVAVANHLNESHPQAAKHPSNGIARKDPRITTTIENSMPPLLHHRGPAPSQMPNPTATNTSRNIASSTDPNPGGQKRLNKSLLQGRIRSEHQKRAQAQSAASPRPLASQEHKGSASGPSQPASTSGSSAKPQPQSAASGQGIASSTSRTTAKSVTEGKKMGQVESHAKDLTTKKDGPAVKQLNQKSSLPAVRASATGSGNTVAASTGILPRKEPVEPVSRAVCDPSKSPSKATNPKPASKLAAAVSTGIQNAEHTSRSLGGSSNDTALNAQNSKSSVLITDLEVVVQQKPEPQKNVLPLNRDGKAGEKDEVNVASGRTEGEQRRSSADEEGKKRKPLDPESTAVAKRTKIEVTSAASTLPNGVGILQIRPASAGSQATQVLPVTSPNTDRQIWEYIVYQKTWSTDERHSNASLFSRCPTLHEANAQAERLYKHTNAQHPPTYSIKFKGWKTSTPNTFGGVCYQGIYVFANNPTQLHHLRIWVSRNSVEATEPGAPITEFVTKFIYVLRLFKLYIPPQTDASDSDSEAGSPSPHVPSSPVRQYQPPPSSTDEAYTILEAANRAAKDLHIDMSFKILPQAPDPKDVSFSKFQMDRKFQEDENRRLNDKLFALDPALGGVGGCWESEFVGLDGESYEVKVQRVGLTGPRNI